MGNDEFDNESQQFEDTTKGAAKKAGRGFGKGLASAGRTAGKAVKKAAAKLLKALLALIKVILPYVLVGLAIFIGLAVIWDWAFEERGSSGYYDLDPANENVVVQDSNGVYTAAALSKNQAYTSAFYKYMSCASYEKTVGGSDVFSFRETTADFAGLQDYYQKENFFYLSPNFIKMADERLNHEEFFYPEQIIKPVSYKLENGMVSLEQLKDDDGALVAKSKTWNADATEQTSTETVGTWDYGLGSMIKYDAHTKEKYVNCEYTKYCFDVDVWVQTTEGGYWEHLFVREVTIPPPTSRTEEGQFNEIMAQYNSVYASLCGKNRRVTGPSRDAFAKMIKERHHINMWLEGEDITIGQRTFESDELADFSNSTAKYPLQIPLINSVATFSGDISYEYTNFKEITEIYDVGDIKAANEAAADSEDKVDIDFTDPAQPVNSIYMGVSPCSAATEFWMDREGDVEIITPAQSAEVTAPVGDRYLKDYCEAYRTYVPASVPNDYDFSARIEQDSTNNELLRSLGLIIPFSGVGSTGADYNVFAVTGLTADDFEVLLDGTAFDGTGANWVALEKNYGVNAIFGMAVAYQESGFGTSNIAKNRNNAFGLLGSNGWMTFDTLSDSIYSFGRTISGNAYYQGKSIDQIAIHYCTSGPSGWARAVKSLMSSRYSDLASAGVDVGAVSLNISGGAVGSTATLNEEDVENQIKMKGFDREDLYANTNFDVLTATNMLQSLDPVKEESGHFEWLGDIFNSLSDLIGNFFESMAGIFIDNNLYNGAHIKYGGDIAASDIDDIVYQTITFSTGTLYTTAFNSIDKENLSFLFVGKEAMAGFGTGFSTLSLIPGVGTKIDGFISPTEENFQAISGWSAATGGVELGVPVGTEVLSLADGGKVTRVVQNNDGSGYTVDVSYSTGDGTYKAQFGCLDSVNVSTGSSVNSGDLIGLSGTKSDGTPCLFFGFTNPDGRNVDPMGYFYQPTYSNMAIVEVAKSQLGNKGGFIYKSWYPLHSLDAWCAAFVSWCADQCGFISSGVFPKFASCGDGIDSYFKPNNIYWSVADNGVFVPVAGNIIFFDWDQDGVQNHVGIVERCENGVIYTIEGNSSNEVRANTYSLYSPDIYGFAFPDYQTKITVGGG